MRRYNLILWLLAIGAAVSMALPGLMGVFAISVIGIPLAILMGVLPALAMVLVPARLLQRLVLDRVVSGGAGLVNGGVAVALVLALLAGIAALDQRSQGAAIAALTAGDLDALTLPLPTGSLAIRSSDPDSACTDLCRRLLLNGAADAVLLQQVQDLSLPFDPDTIAVSYRLERRATCPEPALGREGYFDLQFSGQSAPRQATPSSLLVLRGRIAQGICLIDTPALLGEAEAVITRLRLSQMPLGDQTGLKPGTALITADRLSVHLRDGSSFTETFRWTAGRFARIWPVAILVPTYGYGFNTGIGFGRRDTTFGAGNPNYDASDWPGFLAGKLGLDLAVPDAGPEGSRAVINAVLDREGEISANDQGLIRGYLEGVGADLFFGRLGGATQTLQPDDRALYLRLMQDRRVGLTNATAEALPPSDRLSEAELASLAVAAFDRLRQADPSASDEMKIAGDILARLPAATLAPYRDSLFTLAKDRQRRWHSLPLLTRLGDFGAEGSERLVFLISDARREDWDQTGNGWQHPYLAGLIGLCRMGTLAVSQREGVNALIDAGVVQVSDSSYGRLTVNMLVALDFTPDEVTAVRDRSDDPMPDALLRRTLAGAAPKPDCAY